MAVAGGWGAGSGGRKAVGGGVGGGQERLAGLSVTRGAGGPPSPPFKPCPLGSTDSRNKIGTRPLRVQRVAPQKPPFCHLFPDTTSAKKVHATYAKPTKKRYATYALPQPRPRHGLAARRPALAASELPNPSPTPANRRRLLAAPKPQTRACDRNPHRGTDCA